MVARTQPDCEFGVRVVRGDERLQKTRLGPDGWFCLSHGYMKIVDVLADGEVYAACGWCLTNSPLIQLAEIERIPNG